MRKQISHQFGPPLDRSLDQVLKMRRVSDKTRMLVAYCIAGLILSFAQIALSAEEICVDNYADAMKSTSQAIRNAVPNIKGQNLTNKSKGTHLKFSGSDRIVVKMFSTKGPSDSDPDYMEGVVTVCDRNGELSIMSVLKAGAEPILFEGKCLKLNSFLARMGGDRVHFCPGDMPERIQATFDRAEQKSTVAVQQPRPRSSNDGAVRQ